MSDALKMRRNDRFDSAYNEGDAPSKDRREKPTRLTDAVIFRGS